MRKLIAIVVIALFMGCGQSGQKKEEDLSSYIDPTIGNVSRFLVPTYPTMHLPNQMLRVFPVKKERGYISDQVDAFPLQVMTHRKDGFFRMKVIQGDITDASWKQHMNIDHDLEKVHPWFFSTYLVDDGIWVSFTPGEKSAIYKFDFSSNDKRNILIEGTEEMKSVVVEDGIFTFEDQLKYTTRGIDPITRMVTARDFNSG